MSLHYASEWGILAFGKADKIILIGQEAEVRGGVANVPLRENKQKIILVMFVECAVAGTSGREWLDRISTEPRSNMTGGSRVAEWSERMNPSTCYECVNMS